MSRLLKPGFGDYLDRLSVLTLKIAHATHRDVSHFEAERGEIESRVNRQRWPPQGHDWYFRLAAVNRELWRLVDLQAAGSITWPRVTPEEMAELAESAVLTYRLNEERARLVAQLNGDGLTEKIR